VTDADIFERIRALLDEGAIAASPSNYDFLYRYVTAADPQLVVAVDALRKGGTRLNAQSIRLVQRDLYGTGRGEIGRVLEVTEEQLSRMNHYIEQSDADARGFATRLDAGRSGLHEPGSAERQSSMFAEMIEATNAMLATTERLQSELAASSQEIEILRRDLEIARVESRSDALTGLSNRKACCDYLDAQIERAGTEGKPLSLIFLDIDFFKKFNDNFGHRMGDEVLRLVGQSLGHFFHGRGFVARWGGEEFVIVLPDHHAPEAATLAERFRAHIGTRTIRARGSGQEVGRITLSLGVSGLKRGDNAQQIIDRADTALYDAKADGRDRVVCWSEAA
jgi:diguanylate cyclase